MWPDSVKYTEWPDEYAWGPIHCLHYLGSVYFQGVFARFPERMQPVVVVFVFLLYKPPPSCKWISNHYICLQICGVVALVSPQPHCHNQPKRQDGGGSRRLWQQIVFLFGQKALPRQRALCCPLFKNGFHWAIVEVIPVLCPMRAPPPLSLQTPAKIVTCKRKDLSVVAAWTLLSDCTAEW